MLARAARAPLAKEADCEFHGGGSPDTTMPMVPERVIRAARMPARYAPW